MTLLTVAIASATSAFAAGRIDLGQSMLASDAVGQGVDLRPSTKVTTADGSEKTKYNQYHQGIRVWGEAAPVAGRSRDAAGMLSDAPSFSSGTLVSGISADLPNIKPRLSETDALNIAKRVAKLGGQSQDSTSLQSQDAGADKLQNQEVELVIRMTEQNIAQLVYLTSFYKPGPNATRPHFIIDAQSGRIIKQWEGLTHRDMTGPGGNEKIGQYEYGRNYPAFEVSQDCRFDSANVLTVDMRNQWNGSDVAYTMPGCSSSGSARNSSRAVNGAFSPLNDAQAFGNTVFKMYNDWLSKRPIQQKLTLRVHTGQNWNNATWDGRAMNFGDGDRRLFPLVSLGVIAHEVSHGFTQQNAGLVYEGQSGGMNEAFSDMASAAAEVYARGKTNFMIGDDITRGDSNTAMRYMLDPERDGMSIGHASKYRSGMDVHLSSGVYNKAFALLANKPGWDVRKAFTTFATANMLYWKPQSDFNEGACGVIRAADDRSMPRADVIDVFNQVGVRCANVPPAPGGGGTGGGGTGGGNTDSALPNGVAKLNLTGQTNGMLRYTIDVPAGAQFLSVRTGGGSGDADLYVKYGNAPQPTTSDAGTVYSGKEANSEVVLIKQPQAGRYYVLVHAYTAVQGLSLLAVTR
ncbi:M4 family metallopeptidase [Chitinimonas sp. BJB300]|nr:M4 family metallopeptidase [Chitinimonas sp. BJB300]